MTKYPFSLHYIMIPNSKISQNIIINQYFQCFLKHVRNTFRMRNDWNSTNNIRSTHIDLDYDVYIKQTIIKVTHIYGKVIH